jgi:hypothetical protein
MAAGMDHPMRSHEYKLPPPQLPSFGSKRADNRNECSCSNSAGGIDLEPRVVELETHLKYIRKDIRYRLAYSAGAAAVVLGLLGWVANNRFDQLVLLLTR